MPISFSDADFVSITNAAKKAGSEGVPFPGPKPHFATPFPSPQDWRDQWIYFLMLDRFNGPRAPQPAQEPFDGTFNGYRGGSFLGVARKLDYLRDLGVGALWLSPPLQNLPFRNTYHGYGIHDFVRAERRLAENQGKADDELRHLVDEAHRRGIYVIFDIVLNHTGDVFAYNSSDDTANHSDSVLPIKWRNSASVPGPADIGTITDPSLDALVWPRELQRQEFYRRQGMTVGEDVIGDFFSLKQFRTDIRDLQSFLILAYQYVIARFDCDGFLLPADLGQPAVVRRIDAEPRCRGIQPRPQRRRGAGRC